MTIKVKDYVWEETEETIFLYVPLKGVPANRVDIFSSDDYIKVVVFFCRLGHPNKMFVSHRPTDPIFFEIVKKKKKNPDSLVKEARTLIYEHTRSGFINVTIILV